MHGRGMQIPAQVSSNNLICFVGCNEIQNAFGPWNEIYVPFAFALMVRSYIPRT